MIRANRTHEAVVAGSGKAGERFGWWADWRAHRAARRARPAKGFVSQPEPRSIGSYARGKQIMAGTILLAGVLVDSPEQSLWDNDDPEFRAEAQGFAWLDDLAAYDTPEARRRAQAWTWDWIARFGAGRGPGWSPDLIGRRIIRWVHHATFLLSGRNKAETEDFYRALAQQSAFLSHRWKAARPGLPRFEALTGLVYAGLSLIGSQGLIAPATAALAQACAGDVDDEGGIPSRNPEHLLEVLTLLTWAAGAMTDAGVAVPKELFAAITRIAPGLRALRHADGALARFHGGDRGAEGRLDQSLAASGVRRGPTPGMAMGFARLAGGRTTVILDAADPPGGAAAIFAHASTGAFELTSGRRPVIVSCGAGGGFGQSWRQAARATQSHSVLAMAGLSSSSFGAKGLALDNRAKVANARVTPGTEGTDIVVAHGGWLASHGLTTIRSLTLSHDGRRLSGVDTLVAETPTAKRRFQDLMTATAMDGAGFAIHFHLHPDVDATLDMAGSAVSLTLRSGEIWVLRHPGPLTLSLEPSFYLEKGRLNPRPCKQVVLRGHARGFETRIGWTLAKAKDTPLAIRDLDVSDAEDPT